MQPLTPLGMPLLSAHWVCFLFPLDIVTTRLLVCAIQAREIVVRMCMRVSDHHRLAIHMQSHSHATSTHSTMPVGSSAKKRRPKTARELRQLAQAVSKAKKATSRQCRSHVVAALLCGRAEGSSQVSHAEVVYEADDPFGRACYVGQALRGVPHGAGEMTWRPGGNYRHFVGYFTKGEMTVGRLWFGISGESSYM